jgi:membrane fusion protein, multidrug efflux system
MEQEEKKKKKNRIILSGLLLAVIAGIAIAYWINHRGFITTDNAQIDCNIVAVKTCVPGFVTAISFEDNAFVTKGQVLVVLDTSDLKLKVVEASAALDMAKARLQSAKDKSSASLDNYSAGDFTAESYDQSVISAKANLDKMQSAFDRIGKLFIIKAATQQEFENTEASLKIAKADYTKAISQRKSSTASSSGLKALAVSDANQVSLADAQVKQCEADLLLARNQLGYSIVRAPCNGIASKRSVQLGQYALAGQNLCALVDNDKIWVSANLKETQINQVRIGNKVKISIDAYPDIVLNGKIESFSGATGAKYSLLPPDNATGNFIKITQRVPVKISISDKRNEKSPLLFPGLSVFVKVYTGE